MVQTDGVSEASEVRAASATLSPQQRAILKAQREELRLKILYAKCQAEGREPYQWELDNVPPLPWDKDAIAAGLHRVAARNSESENGPQPGGGGPLESGSGFYRVVRNGIHLCGVTNGTSLHGEVELPVEIGANIQADEIILVASGENPAFSEITTNSQGQLVMKWNTQFVPNGTYSIWLEATEGVATAVRSAPRAVTVGNAVWFYDFMTGFGSQLWMYAELQSANMDYEIAMYDGKTGEYLGTFSDTTTDGTINFAWDVTDGHGNGLTNESFRADFYLAAPGGTMTNAGSRTFGKDGSSVGDSFLVARAEDFNEFHAGAYNDYHPIVYWGEVNVLGHPAANDPYTLSPGNIPEGDTTFQFVEANKPEFFSYLTNMNYQNFFWWGHGSETTLAYHMFDDNGNRTNSVRVWAKDVAKMLGNGLTIRRHPYRLTFIHGCCAAKGRKWSGAFGIPSEAVSVAHFQVKGVRSRAFISNNGYAPAITEEPQLYYAESLALFNQLWMQNYPLLDCLFAATNAPGSGETRRALPTLTNAVWMIRGAQNLQRYGP